MIRTLTFLQTSVPLFLQKHSSFKLGRTWLSSLYGNFENPLSNVPHVIGQDSARHIHPSLNALNVGLSFSGEVEYSSSDWKVACCAIDRLLIDVISDHLVAREFYPHGSEAMARGWTSAPSRRRWGNWTFVRQTFVKTLLFLRKSSCIDKICARLFGKSRMKQLISNFINSKMLEHPSQNSIKNEGLYRFPTVLASCGQCIFRLLLSSHQIEPSHSPLTGMLHLVRCTLAFLNNHIRQCSLSAQD